MHHTACDLECCQSWHCCCGDPQVYECMLQGLAMMPELTALQQGSLPVSAGSTFSAAASSPTALRSQVRHAVLAFLSHHGQLSGAQPPYP